MAVKKTLLQDLANELKVSKTLVSMVINGKGDSFGISKKTQKKVLDKAEEMKYSANILARALRTGKSNLIGLLVTDISNPFYSKIAKFIEKALAEKGYNLMICSTDEDISREESLISLFANQNLLDGLIIASASSTSEYFEQEKIDNFPIVFIDRYLSSLPSYYVVSNNYQGSYDLTDLLINNGSKNILALNISPSHISSLAERVRGFKDCLSKNNIPLNEDNIVEICLTNIKNEVRDVLLKALNSEEKIDAIYALNNNLAIICLEIFEELKIDYSKKGIQLASFDDISLFNFVKPSIISVSQPIEQIGQESVNLLLEIINNKTNEYKQFKSIVLPTSIISRP